MVASWTYRARRRAGLCGQCGEEPLPGGATCAGCLEKMRQQKRRGKGRPKPPRRVEHHVTAPAGSKLGPPSELTTSPAQQREATPEELEIQALTDALIGTLARELGPGKQAEVMITSAGLFLDFVFEFLEARDPQHGFGLSREVLGKLIRERRQRYRAQDKPEATS